MQLVYIRGKIKNKHDTLNFCPFFAIAFHTRYFWYNFRRLRQINSNFQALKRVYRDRSFDEIIKFLSDLVAEKTWRYCGQNAIAIRSYKPIWAIVWDRWNRESKYWRNEIDSYYYTCIHYWCVRTTILRSMSFVVSI